MDNELGTHIIELVGEKAQEVIVIADSILDYNTSSVMVTEFADIALFTKVNTVKTATKESGKSKYIPKKAIHILINRTLTEPLHIVFEYSDTGGQYIYIEIADGVQATIVEHHVLCDCGSVIANQQVCAKVEVAVGQNCEVLYSAFDTSGMNLEIERFVSLKKDTKVDFAIGMFGRSCKTQSYVGLMEQGATTESKLMMFVEGADKQVHLVKMNHFAPNTTSNIINHGVVADHAVGEFEGIGFIEKGSHQADAQQQSRIMVLDDTARADVHPILLIDEYDVMAGHAGSVGRISDEALFYLQSRGLNRKDSMLLVTEGFLRPVVENIADVNTKERIEKVIAQKVGVAREH